MTKRCLIAAVLMIAVAGLTVSCATKAAPASAAPAAAPKAELEKVESTMIDSVGYNAKAQELTVVFTGTGETYVYKNVPEKAYKALMKAESKGKYFTKNIKNKYEFIKK